MTRHGNVRAPSIQLRPANQLIERTTLTVGLALLIKESEFVLIENPEPFVPGNMFQCALPGESRKIDPEKPFRFVLPMSSFNN
ncbi:MAG: hypothetical protein JWQ71_722 [Pedosphaera sp.]|nr:hypothetical protein [Pedosphaera sp.]